MKKTELASLVKRLLNSNDYDEIIYGLQDHQDDRALDSKIRDAIKNVINAGEYDETIYALEDLLTICTR